MGSLKFYNLQLAPFSSIPNPGFLSFFQHLTLSKKSSGDKRLNPSLFICNLMESSLSLKMALSHCQSLGLKILFTV